MLIELLDRLKEKDAFYDLSNVQMKILSYPNFVLGIIKHLNGFDCLLQSERILAELKRGFVLQCFFFLMSTGDRSRVGTL